MGVWPHRLKHSFLVTKWARIDLEALMQGITILITGCYMLCLNVGDERIAFLSNIKKYHLDLQWLLPGYYDNMQIGVGEVTGDTMESAYAHIWIPLPASLIFFGMLLSPFQSQVIISKIGVMTFSLQVVGRWLCKCTLPSAWHKPDAVRIFCFPSQLPQHFIRVLLGLGGLSTWT